MSETTTMTTPRHAPSAEQHRALKILAKSVYRELRSTGYGRCDVVAFTNELLDLVTGEIRSDVSVPDAE